MPHFDLKNALGNPVRLTGSLFRPCLIYEVHSYDLEAVATLASLMLLRDSETVARD